MSVRDVWTVWCDGRLDEGPCGECCDDSATPRLFLETKAETFALARAEAHKQGWTTEGNKDFCYPCSARR